MKRIKKLKEVYRAKLLYSEYYEGVKESITEWLKYLKKQGNIIAIWGGDIKGIAFLQIFDAPKDYISYVIDINAKNNQVMEEREVLSCYDIKDRKIDVILFLNQKHIVQNLDILKKQEIATDNYDVDEIVKRNLNFQEIIAHKDSEDDINEKIRMTEKIQRELIPLLEEVDRICKKNRIPYFLCAGSALGSVRHKGFIPWDDDLDIGMLRSDYEKFLKIADKELSEGFLLMDVDRAPHYYMCHAKVFRNNTALVNRITSHLHIHHGFYLDIFPFDIIPEDKELQTQMYKEQYQARELFCKSRKIKKYSGKNPLKRYLANEEYYRLRYTVGKTAYDKLNKILLRYCKEKPIWIADFSAPYNKMLFFRYDDIFPTRDGEFEGKIYPIPRNPDAYLRTMYGDYMEYPPEEKRYVKHDIIMFDTNKNYELDEVWMRRHYKKH